MEPRKFLDHHNPPRNKDCSSFHRGGIHEDTCLHPQISTQANFCTGCGTTVLILLSPQISLLFTS